MTISNFAQALATIALKSAGIDLFFSQSTNYDLEKNLISVPSVMLNFVFFRKRSNFAILIAIHFITSAQNF